MLLAGKARTLSAESLLILTSISMITDIFSLSICLRFIDNYVGREWGGMIWRYILVFVKNLLMVGMMTERLHSSVPQYSSHTHTNNEKRTEHGNTSTFRVVCGAHIGEREANSSSKLEEEWWTPGRIFRTSHSNFSLILARVAGTILATTR